MQYDLIIKNGIVILESGETHTDIAIKNGKIAAVGPDLGQADQTIDAQGLIVSPGMVDVHEVNDDQNNKDHDTNCKISAN